jgi:F-type H+-transporting ATPase subunit a
LEKTSKWRWGKNRWFVLLFIVLGIWGASAFPPIRPHIQVAPENLTGTLFSLPVIGDFHLTNTMVASFIVYILLFIIAFLVNRAIKSGEQVPKGIPGAIEALIEALYNLTESTAGKHAKKIFPYFATIVLVVLIANWTELIPGVDSIGILEKSAHGFPTIDLLPGIKASVNSAVHGTEEGLLVVPFVRVASTDLNFTVALAIISVVMTQVIGLQAQGFAYFSKFFNVRTLFTKPFFGAMDLVVSLLELISELAKLLSLSLRLFGNIFAGSVLLFLVGSMIPVFAQSMFLLFEFFIGLIQALVFGMLTMVFMSQAVKGHGEHAEEHA